MKSTGIIMQDFSIQGIKKQWEWQSQDIEKMKEKHMLDLLIEGIAVTKVINNMGCKTETRRTRGLEEINKNPDGWELWNVFVENGEPVNPMVFQDGRVVWNFANTGEFKNHQIAIQCPYGKVGDELWVKEKWCEFASAADGGVNRVHYAADGVDGNLMKWKSPMFMPKAASRIKLEITGIGVERLHDITEEGALREGVAIVAKGEEVVGRRFSMGLNPVYMGNTARECYITAFENLHGLREESITGNPWLWVIQFTVKEFRL